MNRIAKIIKDIQYKTDLSIEEIADKIGVSRPHLTRLKKNGDSQKIFNQLTKEFGNKLKGLPEVKEDTITKLTETIYLQQQNIAKLTDVITSLMKK